MNWLIRTLLLVKEIIAKNGDIHFRRYRLLETPWLRFYIHHIRISDFEKHFHDHPWSFKSLLLKGSYWEDCTYDPLHTDVHSRRYKQGQIVSHDGRDTHQITLETPEVWTFVVAWGKRREWGYRLSPNRWIGHQEYRQLKNEGKLR